jgi:hypothetical protein
MLFNVCSLVYDITVISSWLPSDAALQSCYLSVYPYPNCRTAQFLNVLAQVDAICSNVNDCQVKLQGIEGLLQLESRFQTHDVASKNQKIDSDSPFSHKFQQLTYEKVSGIYNLYFKVFL